jgi:hypothetical protein
MTNAVYSCWCFDGGPSWGETLECLDWGRKGVMGDTEGVWGSLRWAWVWLGVGAA